MPRANDTFPMRGENGKVRSLGVCLIVSVLLLTATFATAEPYATQSVIEPFSLEDQHGATHAVDAAATAVLFSRDMDGGTVIREALAEDGGAVLQRKGAIYIADISGMPWFVRSMIAKPRMRDRAYSMLLDEDGAHTVRFPSVEGKATLIVLNELRVVRVTYWDSSSDLRRVLESLPDRR